MSGESPKPVLTTSPNHNVDDSADGDLPEGYGLIAGTDIRQLWERIDELSGLVVNDVRGYANVNTNQFIDSLTQARDLLLSDPRRNFSRAENIVVHIASELRRSEKIRQWSIARGTWVLSYLILWLPLLGLAYFMFATGEIQRSISRFSADPYLIIWGLSGFFGCIGSVIMAIWKLNDHISKLQDFDPMFTLWYTTAPLMGIGVGFASALIITSVGGVLIDVAGLSGNPFATPNVPFVYVVALIAGFRQNVLWAFVERIVELIAPEAQSKK